MVNNINTHPIIYIYTQLTPTSPTNNLEEKTFDTKKIEPKKPADAAPKKTPDTVEPKKSVEPAKTPELKVPDKKPVDKKPEIKAPEIVEPEVAEKKRLSVSKVDKIMSIIEIKILLI